MKFGCPYCQTHLEASDSLAGATVNCPVCGGAFTINVINEPVGTPPPVSPPEESSTPADPPVDQASEAPPEAETTPPPKSDPPKAKPRFRVISRPRAMGTSGQETPSQPQSDRPSKAAPKFRVVSRPQSSGNASSQASSEKPSDADSEVPPRKTIDELRNSFNDFTGLEKLEGFSLLGLFSEIFGKHKPEDIEDMFTVGTARATPAIEEVDTS